MDCLTEESKYIETHAYEKGVVVKKTISDNLEDATPADLNVRVRNKVKVFQEMIKMAEASGDGEYKYPKAGDYGVKVVVEGGKAHMFRLKNAESNFKDDAPKCLELEMKDFTERRKNSVSDNFLQKSTTDIILKGPGIYNYKKVGVVIIYTQEQDRMVMIPYERFYKTPENYSELIHEA